MSVVDSVIAGIADEQPPAASPVPEAKPEPAKEPEQEQEPENEGTPEPELTEDQKERRKLENALKYQRSARSKAQREAQETKQRLEQLEKELALAKPKANDGAPKEADFNSYAEYLEALQDHKLELKLAERDAKAKESQATTEAQRFRQERESVLATKTQEFIKATPDYLSTIAPYADVVDNLPQPIVDAILKAENAPLALYNLAKAGTLDQLQDMDAIDAAVEIRLAARTAPTPKQTKAPPPFSSPRGVATAGKDPLRMTPNELLKSIRNG